MVKKLFFYSALLIIWVGCFREKPTAYDGTFNITLYLKYRDDSLGYNHFLKGVKVNLKAVDYTLPTLTAFSDDSGKVIFNDIPWAKYDLEIRSAVQIPFIDSVGIIHPDSFINITVVDTADLISPQDDNYLIDTIYTLAASALPGIKINEIYYCGPENNQFYFYDQFIELYNSSDQVLYLDGIIVCRIYHMSTWVTYIFQFPGEPVVGREYPIYPGQFVVLAQDAIDHRKIIPKSIDLSNADWEFVNALDFGDWDNPAVPNLFNLKAGNNKDFMINLGTNVILIADGTDVEYANGIDLATVIDCVEYSSLSEHIKDIEKILDRGWAGVGLQKYSGTSVERITPGFDTNNSTVDFVNIKPPTPGYQH